MVATTKTKAKRRAVKPAPAAPAPTMRTLKVRQAPIEHLTFSKENARANSPAQIDMIAESLTWFGWMMPVAIDDADMIVAGEGRVRAALQLGLETVPCAIHSHPTLEQRRLYISADNKLAERSGWDRDCLAAGG